jgi:hypothetical protein
LCVFINPGVSRFGTHKPNVLANTRKPVHHIISGNWLFVKGVSPLFVRKRTSILNSV